MLTSEFFPLLFYLDRLRYSADSMYQYYVFVDVIDLFASIPLWHKLKHQVIFLNRLDLFFSLVTCFLRPYLSLFASFLANLVKNLL